MRYEEKGKRKKQKKIDKHIYHFFYRTSKGNQYKNKRVLVEAIHKAKAEKMKAKALEEQQQARKEKAKLMTYKMFLYNIYAELGERGNQWIQAID